MEGTEAKALFVVLTALASKGTGTTYVVWRPLQLHGQMMNTRRAFETLNCEGGGGTEFAVQRCGAG
jgi:hypothetical protein